MEELKAKAFSDVRCVLGEGPVWNEREQTLSWVDVVTGYLHIQNAEGHTSVGTCQAIGAAIPTIGGNYIACLATGFYLLDKVAPVRKLCAPPTLTPRHRFNDVKADEYGRLWAGEMRYCQIQEENPGSLYVLYPEDGSMRPVSD